LYGWIWVIAGGAEFKDRNRSDKTLPRDNGQWYSSSVLMEYLKLAMRRAHYELLGDDEGYYGEIPGFQGLLAQAQTLEACREELASTLEDWLLFRISGHLPIPVLEGLDLTVREIANPA
jgi:predicted RNase H-like HicB family nuclease